MTNEEFAKETGRKIPTTAERRVAARIKVNVDKRLGKKTPAWIKDLAEQDQSQGKHRQIA